MMAVVEEPGVQGGAVERDPVDKSQSLQHEANHNWNRNSRRHPGGRPNDSRMQKPAKHFHKDGPTCDLILQ